MIVVTRSILFVLQNHKTIQHSVVVDTHLSSNYMKYCTHAGMISRPNVANNLPHAILY